MSGGKARYGAEAGAGEVTRRPLSDATGTRWPAVLLLAGLVFAVAGIAAAIQRPLTQDEVDPFAPPAWEIARRGPSALGELADGSHFPGSTRFEIPHPPLYNLALAAAFRLGGPTAGAARGLGLLCHTAAVILLALIALRAAREMPSVRGGDLAAASVGLYIVLPITIQYPLFIDIDNSLLTPLLLALLWLALRLDTAPSLPGWAGAAAWFAVCLWCKETPPYLALAAIGAWWTLRHGVFPALVRWGTVGATGSALFAVTWWLFGRSTGVPFDAFWQFTIQGRLLKGGAGPSIGPDLSTLWNSTQWTVVWMLPAFLMLGGLAAAGRLFAIARARRASAIDLLALFAVVLFLVHGLYYPGLKYLYPMIAPLVLLIAAMALRRIGPLRPVEAVACVSVAAALVLAFLGLGRDPILPGWGIRREVFFLTAVPLAGAFALLVPIAGRARRPTQRPTQRPTLGWTRGGLLALAVVCLAGAMHQNVRQLRLDAAVPSHGDYGERGAAELISRLDSQLSGDARFIARMDIEFAVRHGAGQPGRERVVVGLFRNERQVSRNELASILSNPRLEAIAADELPRGGWPEFTRDEALSMARQAGFTREETIGDFTLLTKDGARPGDAPVRRAPEGSGDAGDSESSEDATRAVSQDAAGGSSVLTPEGAIGRSSGSRSRTEPA